MTKKMVLMVASVGSILIGATWYPRPGYASSVELSEVSAAGVYLYAEDGTKLQQAPVVGSFVHLEVTGVVARGTVTQFFHNPTDDWMSGVYLFPLPHNAAIDSLRMRIGDQILKARVAELEEAATRYRQALEEGVKASLLRQLRPNVFSMSVAQIGPGEEIEVEIGLQLEIRYDDGRFRMRFPLLAADRYRDSASTNPQDSPALPSPPRLPIADELANLVALRFDLVSGYPLATVTSPTHEVQVFETGDGRYAVELAADLVPADGDVVLEWTPSPGSHPRAGVAVEERDGYYFALLSVVPPSEPPAFRLPREVVFVIDTSGSMEGASLRQAKKALRLALKDLEPSDLFNVIRFSDEPEWLFDGTRPADPVSVDKAAHWVSQLEVNGGTRMLPALAAALDHRESEDHLSQIVFVTDGQVENELGFFAEARRRLGERRLFTIGIGSAPNGYFMSRAAQLGRGTYTFISDPAEVKKRMTSLLRKLAVPALANLSVDWDDPNAEAWPAELGDLYLGEPMVVVARLRRLGDEVRVSGDRAGSGWTETIPLAASHRGSGISKLWARRQVTALSELLFDDSSGDPEEVRRQIVELALGHDLVTQYTSLIAVDQVVTGRPGEAPERPVPNHTPRQAAVAGAGAAATAVTEQITVSCELSMIETTNCFAITYADSTQELIPSVAEPWSSIARAPGVTSDREPWLVAAKAPRLATNGMDLSANVIRLDGYEINDERTGESALALAATQLQEIGVVHRGSDGRSNGGIQIDLSTRITSNWWGGTARLRDATGAGSALQERAAESTDAGAMLYGPIRRDRLFFQVASSAASSERERIGSQRVPTSLEHFAGMLHFVSGSNVSAVASWARENRDQDGKGAGPSREDSATWNHRSRSELARVESEIVASSNLFFSGHYGTLDWRLSDRPRGDGTAKITAADGVTSGSEFDRSELRSTREWRLGGSFFLDSGSADHELEFGLRERRYDSSRRWLTGTSSVVETGANLGLSSPIAVLDLRHPAAARSDLRLGTVWFHDSLQFQRLTILAGARWQREEGLSKFEVPRDPASSHAVTADWSDLIPHLGLAVTLDSETRSILRADWSRYTSRLGAALDSRSAVGYPAVDRQLFLDTDEDLILDPAEQASRAPWVAVRPDLVAEDFGPERIDEASIALEWEIFWNFVAGLSVTHRRAHDVIERRTLVQDVLDQQGAIREATSDDWVPAVGTDGTSFFDLRPGLELRPEGLLVNGDRERESLAATLSWRRRLSGWTTTGHLTWSETEWRLGDQFRRYDDPTDTVGSGDDDGETVVQLQSESPGLGKESFAIGSRWSFDWTFGRVLPRNFELGIVLSGREGQPLPYYRRIARERAGIAALELTERADSLRTADVVTVDARLAKRFHWRDGLEASVALEIFNVFDTREPLRHELDLGVGRGGAIDELTRPRVVRFSVRLGWNR